MARNGPNKPVSAGVRASQYGIALMPKRGRRLDPSELALDKLRFLFQKLKTASALGGSPAVINDLAQGAQAFSRVRNMRIISVPDEPTKLRQRVILRRLERLPVHRAAFGFVRGRGPRDCAAAHLAFHGPAPRGLLLLNADVQDFFHSVGEGVVRKALLAHGLPEEETSSIVERCMLPADETILIKLLMELRNRMILAVPPVFSNITQLQFENIISWLAQSAGGSLEELDQCRMALLRPLLGIPSSLRFGERFLPQGAPTSPALANLACKLIDIRLEAMAKAFGAFYTRYADDFVFSWKIPEEGKIKGKTTDGLRRCAAEVIAEYGLTFNPAKVRVLSPKYAQDIVGYLINSGRPTVPAAYRRRVRQEVRRLSDPSGFRATLSPRGGRSDALAEIQRLQGCAGHIASAHPEEAADLLAQLEILMERASFARPLPRTNSKSPHVNHAENHFEISPEEASFNGGGRRVRASPIQTAAVQSAG
jgi:hypothetical protein